MVHALNRRTATKPAEGEWDCTKCGIRNRGAGPDCGTCGQPGHPSLKAPKRPSGSHGKLTSGPKRATVWNCPECRGETAEPKQSCAVCLAHTNPRLSLKERMLAVVLEPTDSAAELWLAHHRTGATDSELLDDVARILMRGNQPGRCAVGESWICWRVADSVIQIWPRMQTPGDDIEALDEVEILESVRSIYQIPASSAEPKRPTFVEAVRKEREEEAGGPDVRNIAVGLIDRFPLNPRDELEFDEESLRELGGELKQRQVQACVVRAKGERFELIAGERRYRAAKMCKLPTLRCEVVDVGDAEAVWMCGQENERRKDWSAIAKARWYRELKKAEALTDEQLAKRVGVSQGQVTSIMGLLDLPDDWQRRVISQEISATAVRSLIPWAKKRPQVLERVSTELKLPGSKAKEFRKSTEAITVRDVDEAVRQALEKCTRGMDPQAYSAGKPLFRIDAKVKDELDCERLKIHTWSSPVLRAWNTKRWDELQKAAKGKKKEREKKKPAGDGGRSHEYFESHKLDRLVRRWQADLCLEQLAKADQGKRFQFAMLALSNWGHQLVNALDDREEVAVWDVLTQIDAKKASTRLFEAAVAVCHGEEAWPVQRLGEEWNAIGKSLGIDFAKLFEPTEEMLECWPSGDVRKFGAVPKDVKGKPAVIQWLLENWKRGAIPNHVRKLLGLKAGKGVV